MSTAIQPRSARGRTPHFVRLLQQSRYPLRDRYSSCRLFSRFWLRLFRWRRLTSLFLRRARDLMMFHLPGGRRCFQSVNHVHEDCADRRREGHNRGRQTQPSDPAAGRQRLLHPYNTFFKRLADRPRSCGPPPRAVTPCYFELPVARRLSSAVRALSRARTRRFDSCQVQLGTRSAIFVVGRHFVQGVPFCDTHSARSGSFGPIEGPSSF